MLKTRYLFLKKLYPDTVLLFVENGKDNVYGMDMKIKLFCPYDTSFNSWLEEKQISYLKIENLKILTYKKKKNNSYKEWIDKVKLYEILILLKRLKIKEKV